MIEFAIVMFLALIWNVAVGLGFAVLWNLILPSAFGLPEVSSLQGIGIFLILRLVISPPKLDLTFAANN